MPSFIALRLSASVPFGTESRIAFSSAASLTICVDATLVHSRPACTCIGIPATREAKQTLGTDIVANIVMLGALVTATHIVSEGALEKAILDSVPKGTEALNLKAMKLGIELGKGSTTA